MLEEFLLLHINFPKKRENTQKGEYLLYECILFKKDRKKIAREIGKGGF
jgi:hypothetical protein